jgi:hypothetical protein
VSVSIASPDRRACEARAASTSARQSTSGARWPSLPGSGRAPSGAGAGARPGTDSIGIRSSGSGTRARRGSAAAAAPPPPATISRSRRWCSSDGASGAPESCCCCGVGHAAAGQLNHRCADGACATAPRPPLAAAQLLLDAPSPAAAAQRDAAT